MDRRGQLLFVKQSVLDVASSKRVTVVERAAKLPLEVRKISLMLALEERGAVQTSDTLPPLRVSSLVAMTSVVGRWL